MTFDIQKILESKREFRRELAELPIEEKLRMLDRLRERRLAIRRSSPIKVHPQIRTDEHRSKNAAIEPHANAL